MATYELTSHQRSTYLRLAQLALPRHTSYPSPQDWQDHLDGSAWESALAAEDAAGRGLSLYVHVPFCQSLCSYCACNKLIVKKEHEQSSEYVSRFLSAVEVEIERYGSALTKAGARPLLRQIHLGGGTPTYLSSADLRRLMAVVHQSFDVAPDAELAAEIDPRATAFAQLETLRSLGFDRISLGIQDFDPAVQRAINRVQPFSLVEGFVRASRILGFTSINFDLIYGLPFQTLQSMKETLDAVVTLAPDRIAFYRLALIPEMFKWQRAFARTDIPDGELPLDFNLMAINRFTAAGYRFIGLDHFAKPGEPLARAETEGTLRRNFQGMTTGGDLPVIGVGPSAISSLRASYAQNISDFIRWSRATDWPVHRGVTLTETDLRVRAALQDLYCHRRISDPSLVGTARLEAMAEMGLIAQADTPLSSGARPWTLTRPLGELLVRVVAAALDARLPENAWREGLASGTASRVG